jgi:hypothetical protein
MTHYKYRCEIEKPTRQVFHCYGISELTDKLNDHLLEKTGMEEFFTSSKLQNILNGRTKMPNYLKHWKLERSELFYNGFW